MKARHSRICPSTHRWCRPLRQISRRCWRRAHRPRRWSVTRAYRAFTHLLGGAAPAVQSTGDAGATQWRPSGWPMRRKSANASPAGDDRKALLTPALQKINIYAGRGDQIGGETWAHRTLARLPSVTCKPLSVVNQGKPVPHCGSLHSHQQIRNLKPACATLKSSNVI